MGLPSTLFDASRDRREERLQGPPFPIARRVQRLSCHDAPRWKLPVATADQGPFNTGQSASRVCQNIMLPKSQNAPPHLSEHLTLDQISLNIVPQLAGPELRARARPDVVVRAAVPEAAIHEDDCSVAGEDDIGSPGQPSRVETIPEAAGP